MQHQQDRRDTHPVCHASSSGTAAFSVHSIGFRPRLSPSGNSNPDSSVILYISPPRLWYH